MGTCPPHGIAKELKMHRLTAALLGALVVAACGGDGSVSNQPNPPPTGTGPAQAGPFPAYIVQNNSNTVSVLNTTTHSVVATLPVGLHPFGVAVHPAGTFVYVTNLSSGTVSVIDTATHSVVATVLVGGPRSVAV